MKEQLELPSQEKRKTKGVKVHKKTHFNRFIAYLAKLNQSTDSLLAAIQTSPNDLFYLQHSHADWKVFLSHYSVDHTQNQKGFKKLNDRIALICATLSQGLKGNIFEQFFRTGAHLALYAASKKRAHQQYENFIAAPNVEVARSIWNMPDSIKGIYRLFLKKIKIDKVLYVPRTDPQEITLDFVNFLHQQKNFQEEGLFRRKEISMRDPSMSEPPRYMSVLNMNKSHYQEVISDDSSINTKATYDYVLDKKKLIPKRYVKVRLLSNRKLDIDLKTGKKKQPAITNSKKKADRATLRPFCCTVSAQDQIHNSIVASHISLTTYDVKREVSILPDQKLVIHIHGGGFIAQSSFAHSTYLRKWALDINTPILSIDYRLAPEHPYPAALDDCWQAYFWAVRHSEELLNIKPKSIVLVGDSAGANLAVGVTLRAIQKKFRRPDGLILAYPALNLSMNSFTPSHLLALDDLVLPHSFLKLCLQLYVGDGKPDADPFLSPILIDPKDLAYFPTARIAVAGRDPLRDDSFKFALNLLKAGVDVKVREFANFPHGFLNFDDPLGPKECRLGIKLISNWIKELLCKCETPVMKFTESWDTFRESHKTEDTPVKFSSRDP